MAVYSRADGKVSPYHSMIVKFFGSPAANPVIHHRHSGIKGVARLRFSIGGFSAQPFRWAWSLASRSGPGQAFA